MNVKIITKNENYFLACSKKYYELLKKRCSMFGAEILDIQIV